MHALRCTFQRGRYLLQSKFYVLPDVIGKVYTFEWQRRIPFSNLGADQRTTLLGGPRLIRQIHCASGWPFASYQTWKPRLILLLCHENATARGPSAPSPPLPTQFKTLSQMHPLISYICHHLTYLLYHTAILYFIWKSSPMTRAPDSALKISL